MKLRKNHHQIQTSHFKKLHQKYIVNSILIIKITGSLMESSIKETNEKLENPLGSWSDLKPQFRRQIQALFKKQFLIKIRHVASIVEVVIALLLCFIMYPVYILAKTDYDALPDPPISEVSSFPSNLFIFLAMFQDSTVCAMPNNDKMKTLLSMTPYLPILMNGGNFSGVVLPKREIHYYDSISDMEDEIYQSDSNGMAIVWENCNDDDALSNPRFEVLHQSSGYSPESDTFMELKHATAMLALASKGIDPSTSPLISSSYYTLEGGIPTQKNASMTFYSQQFSRPKLTSRFSQVSLCLGLLACMPVVLASMPDMKTVLGEKDSHVAALAFLMGMSETAYWFVNFITPFILCLICYIFSSAIYCFWFALKGTDFTLMLVVSIIFIIAQLWFQFFIATFIKKGSSGRAMTVVMIVFILFFSYLHAFLTLDEDNSSSVLRHIFCIVPFSAYELFMMQDYITCVDGVAPFKWNNLKSKSYTCPPWIPIMWLCIDIVAYFLLFLLFNATNPRDFGTALIKWSEFFHKAAWKRIFSGNSSLKVAPKTEEFMEVKGLSKTFHGTKDVKALDGIDFDIKTGEVIVMIGPNGAGKSTRINTIAGAVEP
ncbi:ABC transporter family protein [Tritrichomonas foetus]|uniref:ABC transporter family protein n=1 Tax=Tritrichomonas foetus TaxID=1144522 RepID=A0A1J4KG98_9EUKA|nr:ABC transporter family protein [Tritrichomonas foetus]|eukprot:OHT08820.1 ABC transporter family protein [Tritrichomonas foetus]